MWVCVCARMCAPTTQITHMHTPHTNTIHTSPVHMETTPRCTHTHTRGHHPHTCTHVWTPRRAHVCATSSTCGSTRAHTMHMHVCACTCAIAHTTCSHMLCAYTHTQAHVCVLAHKCTRRNTRTRARAPQQLLPCFPSPVQSPRAASLQEISKEAVYTISSKEIITIITLSDLAVKFL